MSWLDARCKHAGLQYCFEESPKLHRLQLTGIEHVAESRYHFEIPRKMSRDGSLRRKLSTLAHPL